jgi:hypothetical protein
MQHPTSEIRGVIRELCQPDSRKMLEAVDKYFTPDAQVRCDDHVCSSSSYSDSYEATEEGFFNVQPSLTAFLFLPFRPPSPFAAVHSSRNSSSTRFSTRLKELERRV